MSKTTSKVMDGDIKKQHITINALFKNIHDHYVLYLLALPAVLYMIVFSYGPMYGIIIAFKEYNGIQGIWGSPWVGLDHFKRFFNSVQFLSTLKNTLWISLYSIIVGFPTTIAFAVLINSMTNVFFKKTVQMVTYIPHFISTVVMAGLILIFLEAPSGPINNLLSFLGIGPIDFIAKPDYFDDIYVWSGVWQGTGWSTIMYLSALAGIDPQLHEAAVIDGANKIKRIWHVDLPGIKTLIVVRLILRFGQVMSVGYEKALLLQNPLNTISSEIIQTYTYKIGIGGGEFSFSTAVGLFNSVVNFVLIILVNYISKKAGEEGLW